MKHRLPTIASLALLVAAAQAGTVTWDGEANDLLWATPENWSGDEVPGTGDDVVVNDGTEAAPVVIGDNVATTNRSLRIASTAGSTGALSIDVGGSFVMTNTSNVYVGDVGTGSLLLNGTFQIERQLYVGNATGSTGSFTMARGTVNMGRDAYVGVSGTGTLTLLEGSVQMRHLYVGENAAGVGTVILSSNAVYRSISNGTTIIGNHGHGELLMQGGTASPVNTSANLHIRETSDAYGLMRGWGTWSIGNKVSLVNNGLVIADGDGEERMLKLNVAGTNSSTSNTIENDSTNGWYAVNGGLLYLDVRVNVAAGESGTATVGESAGDDVIDLVNSSRLTFYSVTGKNGILSVGEKLYAPDRTDAHIEDLPAAATKVGVWNFSLTNDGGCSSFDLELRYDHVAAEKLDLALWRHNGTEWTKIDDAEWLTGNRVKASGLTPVSGSDLGLFAITGTANQKTLVILFR